MKFLASCSVVLFMLTTVTTQHSTHTPSSPPPLPHTHMHHTWKVNYSFCRLNIDVITYSDITMTSYRLSAY